MDFSMPYINAGQVLIVRTASQDVPEYHRSDRRELEGVSLWEACQLASSNVIKPFVEMFSHHSGKVDRYV